MRFFETALTRAGRPVNLDEIAPMIKKVAEEYDLALVYLYGSYAKNTAGKLSDLDIAFLPVKSNKSRENNFKFDKRAGLLARLEDIFEEEAIDLVNFTEAPPSLIHRILKDGVCIYARGNSERLNFEIINESLYYDTAPLRKEYFANLRRKIEDGSFGYR